MHQFAWLLLSNYFLAKAYSNPQLNLTLQFLHYVCIFFCLIVTESVSVPNF